MNIKKVKVIRGIIFPSEETLTFIGNIEIQSYTQPRLNDNFDPYFVITAQLQRTIIESEIEFPKLPEILS